MLSTSQPLTGRRK